MQMTLTIHVPRRRPHPVDVVVEWSGRSTAADLSAALGDHLGEPVPGLTSRGRAVPPDSVVGMPPLLHGASVAVDTTPGGGSAATPAASPASGTVLDLVVVGGPDAGRRHPLAPPGLAVGRAPGQGLVVADESLSRRHLLVAVGPNGVTVEDCGSTNGVLVDGVRVDGVTAVDSGSTIVAGASTFRLRRARGPGPPARCPGDGTVRISPVAVAPTATDDVEIACPTAPPAPRRARIPWLAAVAPVPVAIVLAVFLGPHLLVFALLGPLSLLAGSLGDRWGAGRAHRLEVAEHAAAVEQSRRRLRDALLSEGERLDRTVPDPAEVLATAEHHLAGLWRGGGPARVRLGLGDVPTRVVWVEGASRARPQAARAPLVVDLGALTSLGVLGPPETTDAVISGLVRQLCVAHPPHELTVSVAAADAAWAWVDRLPHATAGGSTAGGSTAPKSTHLLDAGGREGGGGGRGPAHLLVVPRGGPEVPALVRAARAAGALVVAGARSRAELPTECDALLHRVDGRHVVDGPEGPMAVVPDLVGSWWVDRLSRALAPLRCQVGGATGGMPSRVTLPDLLLGEELTDEWVAAGWRARARCGGGAAAPPVAAVGVGAAGVFVIDLCRDGPHVLVGGTTGSGKSEFLRTLVTSLAIASPPEDLTFVLVDFKGGAAFGPCAGLPHVVGLVTDLDDHLVSRALASLRAELRRRERLFAAVGAGDLEAYQRLRRPGAEPVPRLVVVVDELRALVDELPGFVTGLVGLAALGRSLGVHLVLATQRPSGVVSADIQANVSLRIAFRVRDRADSVDVIDDASAAGIPSGTPGRALARGADGVLVPFQSATVDTSRACLATGLRVRSPDDGGDAAGHPHPGTEEAAHGVVTAVRGAHRLVGGRPPRAPWPAPLPDAVDPVRPAAGHPPSDSTAVVGLVDEPELQRVRPLTWHPSQGPWLLAGGPGSGRTTALRALVLGAAARSGPGTVHLHVIDVHGSLADLGALPHLGTRVGGDDPAACTALVAHLRAEVNRRRATAGHQLVAAPPATHPTIVVVVDGWDQLLEAQPGHAPDVLTGDLVRVLRDGRSVGVVGVVAGGRGLLHPRWSAVGGRTFLLGSIDPLDAALVGLRSTDVPRDPPPGRAVRVHDRREVQFARATPAHTATVASGAEARPTAGGAWRRLALPTLVRRCDLASGQEGSEAGAVVDGSGVSGSGVSGSGVSGSGVSGSGVSGSGGVQLGIAGDAGAAWCWDAEAHGRRFLVTGPPRSGRTNTLRVMAESLSAAGRLVVMVQLVGAVQPVGAEQSVDAEQSVGAVQTFDVAGRLPRAAGVVTLGPADVDRLVRLRRAHPNLALLVDDVDRLDDAPVAPGLREIAALVERDDGLVVVSTSSAALAGRFRGLDVEVARHGCGLVLDPSAGERHVLGATMPHGIPRLPGRGVVVTHGHATEVQVLLADSSVGGVTAGKHLGVGVAGQPGRDDRHQRHDDDQPADEGPVALHEAQSHGQQDRVPDDRGGAGPRRRADPSPRHGAQPGGADDDQQGRHQHPGAVAALAQDELDDVVHGEPGEGERLQPDEQRGKASGAT